jgi:hypothetical protein
MSQNESLVGKCVLLEYMDDPYNPIEPGTYGIVTRVDGIGQIHVKWDNGRTLALVPEKDRYQIVE